jgi:hypothetical protein
LINALESVEDDLTQGKVTSARLDITLARDGIYEAGREDLTSILEMQDLPPMWQIEAAMHEHRAKILGRYLRYGSFQKDGTFREARRDEDYEVVVWRNDNWVASVGTPGWRLPGVGLPHLISFLIGEPPELVARRWAIKLKLIGVS